MNILKTSALSSTGLIKIEKNGPEAFRHSTLSRYVRYIFLLIKFVIYPNVSCLNVCELELSISSYSGFMPFYNCVEFLSPIRVGDYERRNIVLKGRKPEVV